MRVPKFLSIVFCVTCLCLFYVYQQTEIFRMAYLGQKRQSAFDDLLDKNTLLRYNIKKNGSLVYIGSKIAENSDFQMPDDYRLVRLSPRKTGAATEGSAARQSLVARIFSVRAQAQAKTINP